MGLTSVSLKWLAELCGIMQNYSQGHSQSPISVPVKSCMCEWYHQSCLVPFSCYYGLL